MAVSGGTWSRLTRYLQESGEAGVKLSHVQLEAIIGRPLPASKQYPAFWSNSSGYAPSWVRAGYKCSRAGCLPNEVKFLRSEALVSREKVADRGTTHRETETRSETASADVLLVGCVKTKQNQPAAARDLYVSSLFAKASGYAEATATPWFILSAEHGLLEPETWVSPYDRYLKTMAADYRLAWGDWVVAKLKLHVGDLRGLNVEVHASSAYVEAIRRPLERVGATLLTPLDGLTQGRRLSWYGEEELEPSVVAGSEGDTQGNSPGMERLVGALSDGSSRIRPQELIDRRSDLQKPGLYSWWVDDAGASDLSVGLGSAVHAGLIYAGQAGATRWPSGRKSINTLWGRLVGMHLGKKAAFSTFRLTLGAVLHQPLQLHGRDDPRLTEWMERHLSVIPVSVDDADSLGRIENAVLADLDPPLNLMGMATTPLRTRLGELRKTWN